MDLKNIDFLFDKNHNIQQTISCNTLHITVTLCKTYRTKLNKNKTNKTQFGLTKIIKLMYDLPFKTF